VYLEIENDLELCHGWSAFWGDLRATGTPPPLEFIHLVQDNFVDRVRMGVREMELSAGIYPLAVLYGAPVKDCGPPEGGYLPWSVAGPWDADPAGPQPRYELYGAGVSKALLGIAPWDNNPSGSFGEGFLMLSTSYYGFWKGVGFGFGLGVDREYDGIDPVADSLVFKLEGSFSPPAFNSDVPCREGDPPAWRVDVALEQGDGFSLDVHEHFWRVTAVSGARGAVEGLQFGELSRNQMVLVPRRYLAVTREPEGRLDELTDPMVYVVLREPLPGGECVLGVEPREDFDWEPTSAYEPQAVWLDCAMNPLRAISPATVTVTRLLNL
jgi:hypothetical protein